MKIACEASVLAPVQSRAAIGERRLSGEAFASSASPAGGQRSSGPAAGTGRPASAPPSASASTSATKRSKDDAAAPGAGTAMSDRITPRSAGISAKRHDSPLRSARVPCGAGSIVKAPAFICRSAQASPPPENIA